MEIKRYRNYISWKDKQGNFNTECNRASLENDLCLTIPTNDMTKVALVRGGNNIMNNKNKIQDIPNTCEDGDGLTLFQSEYMKGNKVVKQAAPTIKATKIDSCVATNNLRIRKLTPKECLRLMGFTDQDFNAMREIGMSDAAIYHCAGDSIVVPCLMAIFGQMVYEETELRERLENYVEIVRGQQL